MGIEYEDMRSVMRVLKRETHESLEKLLILGDTIIHFKPADLQELAAQEGITLDCLPDMLTPFSIGQALGFSQVDTLDINGKASINLDLQEPLPAELVGKYDLVIDAGVLFWCFDPGLAIKNIFKVIRKGGLIFHITALSGYYGRGYYNIHPRLFEDFYLSNQCSFIQATYRVKPRLGIWERIKRKIAISLGQLDSTTGFVSYSSESGAIYIGAVQKYCMRFSKTLAIPEADMIPNNVVSTFACRKTSNIEPSSPFQTC